MYPLASSTLPQVSYFYLKTVVDESIAEVFPRRKPGRKRFAKAFQHASVKPHVPSDNNSRKFWTENVRTELNINPSFSNSPAVKSKTRRF